MSHSLNLLQNLLLTLLLALGCAWLALDLARKLRAASRPAEDRPLSPPAPVAPATPSTPVSTPAAVPVSNPAPAPAAVAATPERERESQTPDDGVPATHLAAITAAVHHLFKGRARLASVIAASAPGAGAAATIDWAREGRRDIFTSHRLR
jgi:hypothetical protein